MKPDLCVPRAGNNIERKTFQSRWSKASLSHGNRWRWLFLVRFPNRQASEKPETRKAYLHCTVTLNRLSWLFLVKWFWNLEFYFHSKFFLHCHTETSKGLTKKRDYLGILPKWHPCLTETSKASLSHWNRWSWLFSTVSQANKQGSH